MPPSEGEPLQASVLFPRRPGAGGGVTKLLTSEASHRGWNVRSHLDAQVANKDFGRKVGPIKGENDVVCLSDLAISSPLDPTHLYHTEGR